MIWPCKRYEAYDPCGGRGSSSASSLDGPFAFHGRLMQKGQTAMSRNYSAKLEQET